jgi:GTPase SAR1 family protein
MTLCAVVHVQDLIRHTGDVGGQKTLRSYWRNYFEKTDALIWVVDATDRLRLNDCREELHGLLQEEVSEPLCDNPLIWAAS